MSQLGSVLYAKAVTWPLRRNEMDGKAVISNVRIFYSFSLQLCTNLLGISKL